MIILQIPFLGLQCLAEFNSPHTESNNTYKCVLQATTSYPVENSVNSYLHSIIGGSDISEGTMDELMKRLGFKGATSRITQLEKAGKFFQVCHS